jgi:periplasmic mercuric ion binding protein
MRMFTSVVIALVLGYSVQAADVSTKISNVHLCCKACVNGVEKAVGAVSGATATVDKDAGTVELSAPDNATLQKAANAIVGAGYFGTSSNSKIKLEDNNGAKGKKVESLQVNGVHLCCGKCVKAVDAALKSVPGVESHTAVKDAESFEVKGNFNDAEVFAALQKTGLTGKAK